MIHLIKYSGIAGLLLSIVALSLSFYTFQSSYWDAERRLKVDSDLADFVVTEILRQCRADMNDCDSDLIVAQEYLSVFQKQVESERSNLRVEVYASHQKHAAALASQIRSELYYRAN